MSRIRNIKHFFNSTDFSRSNLLLKKDGLFKKYVYNVLYRSQCSKAEADKLKEKEVYKKLENNIIDKCSDSELSDSSSSEDELSNFNNKWKQEIAWVSKALEPALQFFKWAVPAGNVIDNKPPPIARSLAEIISSIQKSRLGVKDWTLRDLTYGLCLVYIRQQTTNVVEEVPGELISSESIVQDLIYHVELSKGAYKNNSNFLAKNSMLREKDVVKFVKDSSILRPGYYIGVDARKKLVILGIRGTQSVSDLITNIITSSHEEITFEGYSAHFGTAEAARWFLTHEIGTIRKCLEENKGFRLRLVGHSLGAATASLLAIMLRKKSFQELGFDPDTITAVGYASPPCVSKELADSCSDFVTNVIMQDDIIPRLSIASLTRLRKEIIDTDWSSVYGSEDWRGDILKQVACSVQDVARKINVYAKFRGQTKDSVTPKEAEISPIVNPGQVKLKTPVSKVPEEVKLETPVSKVPEEVKLKTLVRKVLPEEVKLETPVSKVPEDLFVPGNLYYLKRNVDAESHQKQFEYFTLLKTWPGRHFQRILLSTNPFSKHECDSHYYALRDVLKGLPPSDESSVR